MCVEGGRGLGGWAEGGGRGGAGQERGVSSVKVPAYACVRAYLCVWGGGGGVCMHTRACVHACVRA